MISKNGILLVAHTKSSYWTEASTLAESIRRFSPHVAIALASDLDVPEKAWRQAGITHYVRYDFRHCEGLAFKLHLDALTPFPGATLFIDSDCICYGDISSVFERFSEHDFVTLGFPLRECHWFEDAEVVRRECGIDTFPFFTGDFYLFRKSSLATKIFAAARELESRYESLRIRRLGRSVNDEPLLSLAMAKAGVAALPHDGSWILQLQAQRCERVRLDYSRRLATASFGGRTVSPRLVHFQAYRSMPLYCREKYSVLHRCVTPCAKITSHVAGFVESVALRVNRRFKSMLQSVFIAAFR
jgi:hypothetical protein